MNYVLRDSNENDIEFILNLRRKTIKPYVEAIWGWDETFQTKDFLENFQPELNKIVTYGGHDIGVLERYESEFVVNISEIHIEPAYQGKGIGSSILKTVIEQAREMNKTVKLGAFKKNHGAIKLYEQLGLHQTGETETHVLMEK